MIFNSKIIKLFSCLRNRFEIITPYDMPIGAATFHPTVVNNSLKNIQSKIVFIQLCRRYEKSTTKFKKIYFHQLQIMTTINNYVDEIYEILNIFKINQKTHDITFKESFWNSDSLAASGKGWEIIVNGLEVCQITLFNKFGGIKLKKTQVELAFGLERLFLINKKNITNFFTFNSTKNSNFTIEDFNLFLNKAYLSLESKNLQESYNWFLLANEALNIVFQFELNTNYRNNLMHKLQNFFKKFSQTFVF